MDEGSRRPPDRDPNAWGWPPEVDRLWNQIGRMSSELKKDAGDRAERIETSLADLRGDISRAIEKLEETKANKWVETALTGAITAVVMAVLMALLALVVVGGKPGRGEVDPPPMAGP